MTDEVLIERAGAVGRIRLNRPQALHALTRAMCQAMLDALLAWRGDAGVEAVLIDHAAGRGFCAGGDVRQIAADARAGGEGARAFFHAEYRLNHLLHGYAKPVVAVMDGVTMGGGAGLALPARFRIATERSSFAMPETGLGLFTDVGAGRYLSRLPGRLGAYLALTGARLSGLECRALGLATHLVAAAAVGEVTDAIVADPRAIPLVLERAALAAGDSPIENQRAAIDRLFAGDTLEAVLAALAADGGEWARAQRAIVAGRAPLSCKISLRLLAEGARLTDFADEMRLEYALAVRMCQRPDFAEGVRALLIDKDGTPRWDPATPDAATDHMIDTIFAPLPPDQAWTPCRL
jgi:enoyl-CoA hydratase